MHEILARKLAHNKTCSMLGDRTIANAQNIASIIYLGLHPAHYDVLIKGSRVAIAS